jgi:hypothetical protein
MPTFKTRTFSKSNNPKVREIKVTFTRFSFRITQNHANEFKSGPIMIIYVALIILVAFKARLTEKLRNSVERGVHNDSTQPYRTAALKSIRT